MAEGPFGGLSPAALAFVDGLARDNSRAFFDAHRTVYEREVAPAMRALVEHVGNGLRAHVSPGVQSDPRVGRSLFRINRDLRFSRDRTPYHPWLDAVWWEGDNPRTSPGFLLRIAADHVDIGAGVFALRGPALARYRRAVDDEVTGASLVRALEEVRRAAPQVVVSSPTASRKLRAVRVDHPRLDLLRLEALHATVRVAHPRVIHEAAFADWCVAQHAVFAPLHRWLVSSLGPSA